MSAIEERLRQHGQAPPLWTKHRGFAIMLSHEFYAPGYDREDIQQEALIGLWIAARTYDPDKGAFLPFAKLVIRRRLITIVIAANRGKRGLLNKAKRDDVLHEIAAPPPDDSVIELHRLVEAYWGLSLLERTALVRSLNGDPISTKRYDNALQRARRKLKAAA